MKPLCTQPTLRGDTLLFSSEGHLYRTTLKGGTARRLTTGYQVANPLLSPDGERVAFTGSQEGASDLYVMPSAGGEITRRTWVGTAPIPLGFDADGELVISMRTAAPFARSFHLHSLGLESGLPTSTFGPALGYDEHPSGWRVLCRYAQDLAHWKRYRGGRMGQLWVAPPGGDFELWHTFGGNVCQPAFIGSDDALRLLFVSDHEGSANLFSANLDGSDVTAHTTFTERSVRYPSVDGDHVVFEHAGDLHVLTLSSGVTTRLDIETHSQRPEAGRRAVNAGRFLQGVAVHPDGTSLLLTTRGKPFFGAHWEGPMLQLGERHGVRHRNCRFLPDGDYAIWLAGRDGAEQLQVCDLHSLTIHPLEVDQDHDRILQITPGPKQQIAIIDTRGRVGILTLDPADSDGFMKSCKLVWLTDETAGPPPGSVDWAPGGDHLVFTRALPGGRRKITLATRGDEGWQLHDLTDGRYRDTTPRFEPTGRFLTFISQRSFDPVRDQAFFGYSFPRGGRPYLMTLQADTPSPFTPLPHPMAKKKPLKPVEAVTIDLEGITHRVVPFPVGVSNYGGAWGLPSGRFLLTRHALRSSAQAPWKSGAAPPAHTTLFVYDPDTKEQNAVGDGISGFAIDPKRKTLALRIGNRVRVVAADVDKATRVELKKKDPPRASRKTFWIDVERARVTIEPKQEWRQMFTEAWALQRDFFFDPNHGGVDWDAVLERYLPEVERVSSRSELTDLIQCMHGELATSHAFTMGGDVPGRVRRAVGLLAADFELDEGVWTLTHAHLGDIGDPRRTSPLLAPGLRFVPGTRVRAIDGQPVSPNRSLESYLVGHSGRPVRFDIERPGDELDVVWVKPLSSDLPVRYRTWVAERRRRVHEATDGRAGYVHLPNMGATGFADFHRDFLAECTRDALVVDVRYNTGGHVSQLVLSRLMQRRLAYTDVRDGSLNPYPSHSVLGPMVALANAMTASDGDIFSHQWKALELGPLIGERTWGGVVGISPRFRMVDGTLTTQPEAAFWMTNGTGYGVEGHGVEPDDEVFITPNDWATHSDADPQLDRAIERIQTLIDEQDPKLPDLGPRPIR